MSVGTILLIVLILILIGVLPTGTQQRLGLRTLRHPRYSSGRTTGIAADGQNLGERRRASSAGF